MYVDNILAILIDATAVLESLKSNNIRFKNDKINSPDMYLGAKLQHKSLNGNMCWAIMSVDYVNAAIKTMKDAIDNTKWKISTHVPTPMTQSYYPELDESPELSSKEITLFQELIGMLQLTGQQERSMFGAWCSAALRKPPGGHGSENGFY